MTQYFANIMYLLIAYFFFLLSSTQAVRHHFSTLTSCRSSGCVALFSFFGSMPPMSLDSTTKTSNFTSVAC